MSSSVPPGESQAGEREARVLILDNATHGGTTVKMDPSQLRVRVSTGAGGHITVTLPPIDQVEIGVPYTINLIAAAANTCIVDDALGDALVASFATTTLTTAGDYVVAVRAGDQWFRLTEKVAGGAVVPA